VSNTQESTRGAGPRSPWRRGQARLPDLVDFLSFGDCVNAEGKWLGDSHAIRKDFDL